jgi:excisionase family DNA binding protein
MSEKSLEKPQSVVTKLLKASDVANIMSISRSFAYQLLETGQLPTVHLGRSVRVRAEDLRVFIEKNTTSGYGHL